MKKKKFRIVYDATTISLKILNIYLYSSVFTYIVRIEYYDMIIWNSYLNIQN